MIELRDHPWFVATQAHPELKSRPTRPHPLFRDFVRAVRSYAHQDVTAQWACRRSGRNPGPGGGELEALFKIAGGRGVPSARPYVYRVVQLYLK